MSSLQVTTNFRDSNGADLGTKLVTKDYLISVYPEIGQQIGIPPELWTWGSASNGALGNNTSSITAFTPITTFAGGTNWKHINAGNRKTGAIKTDGTLWIWGSAPLSVTYSSLTSTSILTPITTFAGGNDWKQVNINSTTGDSVALKTDGSLWFWGANFNRMFGNNAVLGSVEPVTTTYTQGNWKQISATDNFISAIKVDGTLWTWGEADYGLGRPQPPFLISTPITTFAGGTNWADTATAEPEDLYTLSLSRNRAAAIKTDGTLWIWGNGSFGSGTGISKEFIYTPVTTFVGGTNWKQVDSGDQHTAAIKTDGTLWTWGNSSFVGITISNISTPVTTFAGGTNWADTATAESEDLYTLSAGGQHTIAIKTDGTLWSWGYGVRGQLGNARTVTTLTPVTTFSGGTNWKQVSAAASHTAAVKTDGTLWAWGNGFNGQLGNLSTTFNNSTPITTFAGGTNWKQVSSGNNYTAAIKTDGTLWTWGAGTSGQLGRDIFITTKSTPITTFAGGTNWADTATTEPEDLYTLSAGTNHTAAIKTDGTLWTWGYNTFSQLGINNRDNVVTPVTTFTGGTNWKQVSCNINTSGTTFGESIFAIKTDGTLWGWGSNGTDFGRLGINTNDTFSVSTPITTFAGGTNWKQVSCKNNHVAAIKTDGTLWTWGAGGFGRLGNSQLSNIFTPITTFAGGTNWKQVSTGRFNTAAIKTDGTLWTWGNGSNGQLGIIVSQVLTDGGISGICNTSTQLTGTSGFFPSPNSGTRITTSSGNTGTVTSITNSLLGAASLTSSTTPTTGNTDDGFWELTLPFNISYNGTSYGTIYVGTNSYVTFNSGFTVFSNISFSNPSDQKIMISAADRSGQRIYFGTEGTAPNRTYRVIFEGSTSTSGTLGSPTMLWEMTFYENATNQIDIQVGINNAFFLANPSFNISTPVTTFAGGTDWKQVSCGGYYTAAIKTDGTLWTWGNGNSGQLGNANLTIRSTPVTTFAGGTDWKQVSAGTLHTTAVKTDGTLWTWGNGGSGRLGNTQLTNRSTPVTTFAGGTNWKQVSAANTHTVALRDDGVNKELYIWGSTSFLGENSTTDLIPKTTFAGGTDWKQVSSGNFHTAAIKTDGTLWTWGNGNAGRLGTNDTINRTTPVTTFAGGTDWKQVSSGTEHTAAIKTDGTLWSWGSGTSGRLGINSAIQRNTPVTTFAGGTDWKQVGSGNQHTAAIKTDGTLWTWGNGSNGQLGNAVTTGSILTPVTTFAGGSNWKQVSASSSNTVALRDDGVNKELYLFGSLTATGIGTFEYNIPTNIDSNTNWKQVSAGFNHTAAIKTDGTLWVWGNGTNGQLGIRLLVSNVANPVTTFAGGTDWKQVSSGNNYTAAIKTDGTLWVWGSNNDGQLGNGITSGTRSIPVTTFAGGNDWKQVSASGTTAAIKTDGTLWVWGDNYGGRLGTNDSIDRSTPVTTFAGGNDWKQVSASGATAAIKTDGTLWTWGYNYSGQLGDNTNNNKLTPVTTFAGGTNWKQVNAGATHTAALKDDGVNKELYIFGSNNFLIGNNNSTTRNENIPSTTFAGGNNWKQVSSGNQHTAAIKTDGTLWTWGNGDAGRLGTNDTIDRFTPVTTFAGGINWKQVSSGNAHIAAIKTDGTLWSWGYNYSGELGSPQLFNIYTLTPVTTFAGGNDWQYDYDTLNSTISSNSTYDSRDNVFFAIKNNGSLWTWGFSSDAGFDSFGTNNTDSFIGTPVTVFSTGTNWKQISTAASHTAAIKTDGTLWVWGDNYGGRLGNNIITSFPNQKFNSTPITTFAGGTNWKQVSAGFSATGAIKTDGTLWIWGYNINGQVGNNTSGRVYTPVTTFAGGNNWSQISCNGYSSAAIKTDGTLWTWGADFYGNLGIGFAGTTFTPVTTFAGGTDWKEVNVGHQNTAAIKTDGTLWVWGNNQHGQIGNASIGSRVSTPVTTFAGGTNWKQVSAGGRLSGGDNVIAAVKTDGTLWTWGYGYFGQLGNNAQDDMSTPVTTFAGGTDWAQVSIGLNTIAVKNNGSLYVFGYSKTLGINYIDFINTPITTFAGGTNWKQVSAGFSYTSAIKTDGTLWTWGSGSTLGVGSNTSVSTPVTTFAGGTNWKQINAGASHVVAIRSVDF
jgi:alpha-tubulin suppressor-like RCC1 family protein